MEKDETVESIINLTFAGDTKEYYVVGTAQTTADDPNVHKGRLLVFSVSSTRHVNLDAALDIFGAPWALKPFNGRLVAGINGKVRFIPIFMIVSIGLD